MSKQSTFWEKANISYSNYLSYIGRKQNRYDLSLIDLFYVSNFKGGNASINEDESTVNRKLTEYSNHLKAISDQFGTFRLIDLSDEELPCLKKRVNDFLELTRANKETSIDGFKGAYASALLHFYFPNLIPILDRRVLQGIGIKVQSNSQGQIAAD